MGSPICAELRTCDDVTSIPRLPKNTTLAFDCNLQCDDRSGEADGRDWRSAVADRRNHLPGARLALLVMRVRRSQITDNPTLSNRYVQHYVLAGCVPVTANPSVLSIS